LRQFVGWFLYSALAEKIGKTHVFYARIQDQERRRVLASIVTKKRKSVDLIPLLSASRTSTVSSRAG